MINGISGGGYGAISTTGLISAGIKTNIAIGSTVLAETVVALTGVILYLFFIQAVNWELIIALIVGGLIATPIGALTTKRSPSKKLGAIVAIIVILLGVSSAIVRSEALVMGLVSAVLILITYHFKMVGHRRIRIGMGGINLGIGAIIICFAYLFQANAVLFNIITIFKDAFFWYLIFSGIIFIIAGILDFSVN